MNKRVKSSLLQFIALTILISTITAIIFWEFQAEDSMVQFVVLGVGVLLVGISAIALSGLTVFFIQVDNDTKEGEKMEKIIMGLEVAKSYRQNLKQEIETMAQAGKRVPHLCVILVGDNPASLSYIKGKEKACAEVGMKSTLIHLKEETTQQELSEVVSKVNNDEGVDGILVQLPLPKHLNEKEIIYQINPQKDVDGLHPMNMGKLMLNEKGFVPCTPLGVMALLKETVDSLEGKRAVVVGRSPLVGNPVAQLLMRENTTVTICHSKTKDTEKICKEADILVVAIGKAKWITKEYIKKDAIVIDVGVNRTEDGKLVGDVDFDSVVDEVAAITPVPRGVGPMTITMLLKNTLQAYKDKG